jgi:hypothetical protein
MFARQSPTIGQRGQAMVFSLLFMAVIIIILMVLYNQGLLVRHRMQVENASDAAVYSVAKLGARQMNLSAYLNRAMVANDILVGQMSGLVSSFSRYENTKDFVGTFPLYRIPLGPTGLTMKRVLTPITAPVSAVFGAIGKPVKDLMPFVGKGTAGWNKLLGVFEHVFAVATVMTQFAAAEVIVNAHATPRQVREGRDPDIPGVGYFFLAQNAAQTYFGDAIDWSVMKPLYAGFRISPFASQNERDHISEYIDENVELITNSLLQLNSFKAAGGGASDEAHRYAALVNDNRDPFLLDRGRDDLYIGVKDSFEIPLFGLRFEFGAGIVTDGGSAYRFKEVGGVEKYGWSSLDVISGKLNFTIEFKAGPLPWLPIPNFPYIKNAPMPLGGATHQLVHKKSDAMRFWLFGNDEDWGGGDYGDAIDDFYLLTLNWMDVLGLFGDKPKHVQEGAGGMPTFWSVNPTLRHQNRAPPYALAVMQDMRKIHTTDRLPKGAMGKEDSDLPLWLDVSVRTRSVGDSKSVGPISVSSLMGSGSPMVSVSSAELYHKRRNTDERANLFSPFWDVRLVENSPLTVMIMRGMQNPANLIAGLPFSSDPNVAVSAAIDFVARRSREELQGQIDQLPVPVALVGETILDTVLPAGM